MPAEIKVSVRVYTRRWLLWWAIFLSHFPRWRKLAVWCINHTFLFRAEKNGKWEPLHFQFTWKEDGDVEVA